MFIRSERLFLRPGWPEDWAELLALIDDEAVVRNLARAPWPYRPEDARAFAGLSQDPRHPHFFITQPGPHGARLIGCVGLIAPDAAAGGAGNGGGCGDAALGTAELGYWIGRPFWGRGFASEAVRAVLPFARTLGHRRVTARALTDNPASLRVLAKVGMRPVGAPQPRFSAARGETVAVQDHVLDLDMAGNCNGDGEGPRKTSLALNRAA